MEEIAAGGCADLYADGGFSGANAVGAAASRARACTREPHRPQIRQFRFIILEEGQDLDAPKAPEETAPKEKPPCRLPSAPDGLGILAEPGGSFPLEANGAPVRLYLGTAKMATVITLDDMRKFLKNADKPFAPKQNSPGEEGQKALETGEIKAQTGEEQGLRL
jgi:hypothetical protein